MADKKSKKIRVAVLMGGPSAEHEISLRSGENVLKNLPGDKYEARKVFIDKDGNWEIPLEDIETTTDVVFIALHGSYGEDGTVQALLDGKRIVYTGSHALTSALAMNKYLTLRYLQEAGFTIPLSFLISKLEWNRNPFRFLDLLRYYSDYPFVVKPNDSGSSDGVKIVDSRHGLVSALEDIFMTRRFTLVQPFIRGREVTCGVLDHGWPESAYALLPTEIVPRVSNFFDYRAKYEPDGAAEITPARFPGFVLDRIRKIAVGVHRAVGASGFSRTDMIVDKNGDIFILEINTIPGLTKESLLPKAAEASGIPFPDLLHQIIQAAIKKYSLKEVRVALRQNSS